MAGERHRRASAKDVSRNGFVFEKREEGESDWGVVSLGDKVGKVGGIQWWRASSVRLSNCQFNSWYSCVVGGGITSSGTFKEHRGNTMKSPFSVPACLCPAW